ncbi:MAG: hypothetical protein ACI3XJ_01690 [Oscillospiraceae bacterium]
MKRALILLLAFLPLAGCEALPFARELEDTMLVQVLGVDWTDNGVTLTAASDPGEGSGEAQASVLSGSGRNLAEAEAALKGAGEEYVSLTHVTQLVLGADTDLPAVLEAALKEPALGQSATVWLAADGTARELLEGAGGGAKRLSSIELNSQAPSATVLQSLMRLEEDGRLELPLLALEEKTLVLAGTVQIREDADGT